ncbi:HNH endonuclease [Klebsiella variicola]|uniref:HNH endonuclease n=1 Tax=Klebsiella variicola TaxID=244366 RepID=UPI00216A7008|nr:HNH endonuclease [Klebsiella variicola]MCS4333686.1 HNH endonuclease [Klebsiella variicola subsp. variicola]
MRTQLTQAELKRRIHYDPETGVLTRRISFRRSHPVGSIVGAHDKDGYLKATVLGVTYQCHRLAWFYVHGKWPIGVIDHIDLNKSNNRIKNLRDTSKSGNEHNRGVRKDNKSGYKGVFWSSRERKWKAAIKANGKKIHLGTFPQKIDAVAAYDMAAKRLHGEFARPNLA